MSGLLYIRSCYHTISHSHQSKFVNLICCNWNFHLWSSCLRFFKYIRIPYLNHFEVVRLVKFLRQHDLLAGRALDIRRLEELFFLPHSCYLMKSSSMPKQAKCLKAWPDTNGTLPFINFLPSVVMMDSALRINMSRGTKHCAQYSGMSSMKFAN